MTWPNLLSAFRMGLIPVFVIAIVEHRSGYALLIFAVAGLTDLIDGFVARYLQQQSALGAYLDPMADKLLLTAAYVLLAVPGLHTGVEIPIWITALVITRDVLIVLIALLVYLAFGISKFPPSRISKWNTVFQISAVVAVLLSGLDRRFDLVAWALLYATVILTAASGLEYGYRFVYRSGDLAKTD